MARRLTIAEEAVEETDKVLGILIDPEDRTVRYVALPTLPGEPGRYGQQLAPERLVELLGKPLAQVDLVDGEVLLVALPEGPPAWRFDSVGPHEGPGIVVHYDRAADAYSDATITLERAAELVAFEDEAQEADENEEVSDAAAA